MSHIASYWQANAQGMIQCTLCPQGCLLGEGQIGTCGARRREGDQLIADTYGRMAALNVDPMEKKPLYHFHPGSDILSIGMNGCNLSCAFCQNWQLSQERVSTQDLSVSSLMDRVRESQSIGVAYTYSEPLVAYEYVLEASKACNEEGFVNVLVTNGTINPAPLERLLPHVHAANVDLKSIRDDFYRRLCGSRLAPVQRTLRTMKESIHVEVTNLLITDENDSVEDVQGLVDWIADELGPDTPLHLSRYFPQYRMDHGPTSLDRLSMAYDLAKGRLQHVYVGNARLADKSDTFCPACGAAAIERTGYRVVLAGMTPEGNCAACGGTLSIRV